LYISPSRNKNGRKSFPRKNLVYLHKGERCGVAGQVPVGEPAVAGIRHLAGQVVKWTRQTCTTSEENEIKVFFQVHNRLNISSVKIYKDQTRVLDIYLTTA
jgi:hypothetical protein